jgi:hypothetical protein
MKSLYVTVTRAYLGLLLIGFITSPGLAQSSANNGTQQAAVVKIDSHRPLFEALWRLQDRINTPIRFEESPYENSSELMTSSLQTRSHTSLIVPRGGSFEMTLPSRGADSYSAVQNVVSEYNNAGLPGMYQVVLRTDSIDVLPTQVTGSDGVSKAVSPVLIQQITVPTGNRAVLDTLKIILDTTGSLKGKKILLAEAPIVQSGINFGVENEQFADVIKDLFSKAGVPELTTILLYDPAAKVYYLTLRALPAHNIPGTPGPTQPIVQPRTGPANSPFFVKTAPQK